MMDHLEKIHWAIQTTLELLKGFSLSSLPAEPLRSILDRACGNLEEAGVLRDRKVVVDQLLERAEEGGLGDPRHRHGSLPHPKRGGSPPLPLPCMI